MTGWWWMTNSSSLAVKTAIRPLLVQRAGRGPMSPSELLRGFAISKGTILP